MNPYDYYMKKDMFGPNAQHNPTQDAVSRIGSSTNMRTSTPNTSDGGMKAMESASSLGPAYQLQGTMGNGNADAADAAGTAAMSSGNPWAMAAGAALKVLSASSKRKREKAQQDAQNIMSGSNAMAQSILNTPVVG